MSLPPARYKYSGSSELSLPGLDQTDVIWVRCEPLWKDDTSRVERRCFRNPQTSTSKILVVPEIYHGGIFFCGFTRVQRLRMGSNGIVSEKNAPIDWWYASAVPAVVIPQGAVLRLSFTEIFTDKRQSHQSSLKKDEKSNSLPLKKRVLGRSAMSLQAGCFRLQLRPRPWVLPKVNGWMMKYCCEEENNPNPNLNIHGVEMSQDASWLDLQPTSKTKKTNSRISQESSRKCSTKPTKRHLVRFHYSFHVLMF